MSKYAKPDNMLGSVATEKFEGSTRNIARRSTDKALPALLDGVAVGRVLEAVVALRRALGAVVEHETDSGERGDERHDAEEPGDRPAKNSGGETGRRRFENGHGVSFLLRGIILTILELATALHRRFVRPAASLTMDHGVLIDGPAPRKETARGRRPLLLLRAKTCGCSASGASARLGIA